VPNAPHTWWFTTLTDWGMPLVRQKGQIYRNPHTPADAFSQFLARAANGEGAIVCVPVEPRHTVSTSKLEYKEVAHSSMLESDFDAVHVAK